MHCIENELIFQRFIRANILDDIFIFIFSIIMVLLLLAQLISIIFILKSTFVDTASTSVKAKSSSFYVIPLGTSGGLEENNLSAYLLTSVNGKTPNSAYILLDGGTIRHGLE